NTPLGTACLRGHTQVAELLLKHGVANINHTNIQERTPLGMACIEGHTEVVKLLLERGAKVNVTDENGLTPLCNASIAGHTEIVKLLLEHGDVANVDHPDGDNDTPLIMACIGGHKEVVELLLKHGANVNHLNKQKCTPLVLACIGGHAEIVKLLKEIGGVDINATDELKNTPLVVACKAGQKGVVEMLLKIGAKVNVTDYDGNTPLAIACMKGHTEIVELLLNHGIDNTNNTKNKIASAEGQPERVKINGTNKKKHTALHIACYKGHTEIVELLLKHGAKVAIFNEDRLNALDIAVEEGKKDAAMAIVKSDKWKNALRSYTVDTSHQSGDKVCGIRRLCCCKNDDANKQFTTPMRRIIKKMPDVAKVVFEKCCETDKPPDHPNHEIKFNYEFLDDFDKIWTRRSKYSSENHCLSILANSPSADLLKHPLAATLLDQKWNKIGRIVYYTNLIFYFLFVILLTSYALTVHPPNSNICMEVFGNGNETSIDCLPEERFISQRYIPIASICLIVYSAILIIREAFELILFREKYFTSFVNYIDVSLFIFTIMFASVHGNQCYCTRPWQWQVGVIAVFLSWIALILSIRKLPVVGIYVVMFIKIFNNFIKVVILALLLILAFAVPFYMMFYDPQDRAEGIRTPFITPWRTTVKAISMTVGALDIDSLLRQDDQRNAPDVQYPVVAFSLVIVFVILMPILFLNLLIGLAVGDTDEIQKSADTYRLTLRVEFTLPIEQLLRSFRSYIDEKGRLRKVSFLLGKIVAVTKTDKPNKHNFLKQKIDEIEKSIKTEPPATLTHVKNQTKSLSDEMKSLHNSVSQEVKDLRSSVSEEVKDLRSSVSEEVKDLRSSMDQLLAIVNSMNERVGGGGGTEGEEKGGGGGTGAGGTGAGGIGAGGTEGGRGGTGARGLEEEVEQKK
uniref:Ion transport domain-containing protein n=1 Tax=Amphimedon queenslandica TaxID=400682 RepID=A0A1X7U5M2_AMPQE